MAWDPYEDFFQRKESFASQEKNQEINRKRNKHKHKHKNRNEKSHKSQDENYEKNENKILEIPFWNQILIKAIENFPRGRGYGVSPQHVKNFSRSVQLGRLNDGWNVEECFLVESFCTSATYSLFLMALNKGLNQNILPKFSEKVRTALLVGDSEVQKDGVGFWGWWNSDGPGVAALWKKMSLGKNFQNPFEALPGDFFKFSWTPELGEGERGHLTVFHSLRRDSEGRDFLCFWSSQSQNDLKIPGDGLGPSGYSLKCVSLSNLHHCVFSRLESPENLLLLDSVDEGELNGFLFSEILQNWGAISRSVDEWRALFL